MVSFFAGGAARFDGVDTKVDSLFDFPLLFALRGAFAGGKPVRDVAQMLGRDHLYPDASRLTTFLGNHDVARFMNEPGATTAGLKLAQTFILTTRGTPQLYYGDEIAIRGGGDPDNRRSMPGAFPGDPRNAFAEVGPHARRSRTSSRTSRRCCSCVVTSRRCGADACGTSSSATSSTSTPARSSPPPWSSRSTTARRRRRSTVPVADAGLDDGAVLVDRLAAVPGDVTVNAGSITLALLPRTAAILVPR